MKIEVLVATMNQYDHSLIEKMNIQSDAIIANQCNINKIEEFLYNGNNIKYFSFAERGVGLNRNNALSRSTADICILADDDMVFQDNYVKKIEDIFLDNPKVDVIVLNIDEENSNRFQIRKKFKVGYHNYMRFGAARLAFRRKSITKNGISFNIHFGGGTEFSAGEDVLFLTSCLNKKLNIIAIPEYIAKLTDVRESTWFKGYTDKFFIDKGVLFAAISRRWAKLLCFQFCIKRKNLFKKEKSILEAYQLMKIGIMKFKNF